MQQQGPAQTSDVPWRIVQFFGSAWRFLAKDMEGGWQEIVVPYDESGRAIGLRKMASGFYADGVSQRLIVSGEGACWRFELDDGPVVSVAAPVGASISRSNGGVEILRIDCAPPLTWVFEPVYDKLDDWIRIDETRDDNDLAYWIAGRLQDENSFRYWLGEWNAAVRSGTDLGL